MTQAVFHSRNWKYVGGRCAAIVVVGWIVLVIAMWGLENFLVFRPTAYDARNAAWTPRDLDYEEVEIESTDGAKLCAWYAPREQPAAVVLLLHGNGGNISGQADELRILQQRFGVAALALDYRGYGKSTGSPTEAGVLADARAARKWLANRCGIAEKEVVLWGFSMGGGVAVDLAARDGARALILQSTFTSLPDAAAVHYPWLPVRWLMRNRLDSANKIADYHGPLFQLHGDADSIVPIELGKRLHALANEPKEFVVLRGADHNDRPSEAEFVVVGRWLEELPSKHAK